MAREYDFDNDDEKAVHDALLPIAAHLVAKLGFASDAAKRDLTASLAYYGMLIAIGPKKGAGDDERYGSAGCDVRDDMEIESGFREDEGLPELEDLEDTAWLRDQLEEEITKAIRVIRHAADPKKAK